MALKFYDLGGANLLRREIRIQSKWDTRHSLLSTDPEVGSFGLSWNTALNSDIVVPESSVAGSNDRLRILLAQSRVAVEQSSYDGTTLAHFGPDGTVVLTDEYLWELPCPNQDSYIDLNERFTCSRVVSSETWCPDAPWWAIGPNVEALESFR